MILEGHCNDDHTHTARSRTIQSAIQVELILTAAAPGGSKAWEEFEVEKFVVSFGGQQLINS